MTVTTAHRNCSPPGRLLGSASSELLLQVRGGEHDGRQLRLRASKCTIGSAPGNTLRLRAPGVRPLHCWILQGSGGTIVRSFGPNVFINGATFTDTPLAPGDVLRIGRVELQVVECSVRTVAPVAKKVEEPVPVHREPAPELDDAHGTIRRLQAEIEEVERRAALQLGDLNELVARLSDEKSELHQRLREEAARTGVQEQHIARLEAAAEAKHQLQQQLQAAVLERGELIQQLEQLKFERSQSQYGQQAETASRERETLLADLRRLEDTCRSVQTELESRNRELQDLRAQISSADEAARQSALKETSGRHQAAELQLATQRREWDNQRAQLESHIARLQTLISEHEQRLDQSAPQEELQSLQEEISSLQRKLEQFQAEADRREAELSACHKRLAKADEQLAALRAELEASEAQWAERQSKHEALQYELVRERAALDQQLQREKTELSEQVQSLAARAQELQLLQSDLAAQAEELRNERAALEVQAADLLSERQELAARQEQFAIEQELLAEQQSKTWSNVAAEVSPALDNRNVEKEFCPPAQDTPVENIGQTCVLNFPIEPAGLDEEAALEPAPFALPSIQENVDDSESAQPALPPAAAAPEQDESIESYMQRLLQRVRGPETTTSATKPAPVLQQPLPEITAPTPQPAVAAQPSKESQNMRLEDLSPRIKPPEQNINLVAMRELANTAARSAIDRHAKRRGGKKAFARVALAAVTFLLSAALAYCSWLSDFLPGAIASGIGIFVSTAWCLWAILPPRRRSAADLPKESEAAAKE